jgi:hypothetical protein
MHKWDGHERRTNREDREGRRVGDQRCPDHHLLWKQHDEDKLNFRKDNEKNQGAACGKIAALEAYHIRDVAEVKVDMDKKAEKSELRSVARTIGILITVGCLVVGGMLSGAVAWLKTDISVVSSGVQRLNIRVTESMNSRIQTDIDQTRTLETITGQLGMVNYRLEKLEETHKEPRDGRDGKTGRDGRDSPRP